MRLTLKATNTVLDDSIKEYLDKRLATLQKVIDLEDPAVLVAAELGRSTKHQQGDIFYAEVNIYRGKESWRAVANDTTLTAAIDAVRDEIMGEVTAAHGKKISLMRRGGLAAKYLLKGGHDGLEYLGRPAKAGWKYMRRMWRKKEKQ